MLYLLAVMHQFSTPLRALLLGGALLAPPMLNAHEIPVRVAISGWVVPRDSVVDVYLRVPLEAMRDLDFPLRADSMLDLARARALLPTAAGTWIVSSVHLWADGVPLGAGEVVAHRLAMPLDRAFDSHDALRTYFSAPPLADSESLPWQSALLDVHLRFRSPTSVRRYEIDPALAHLGVRTTTVLRLLREDGAVRAFSYAGNVGRLALDPSWVGSALRFVRLGFSHILGGIDHLLFVLCLVLPVRRVRPLVAIVTAFTLAHSLTLGAAALGWVPTALWFPPLVELLIAASIVWLAVENFVLTPARLERRWAVAFGFGLIHGFGFSFALAAQLQFAGAHLVTALLAFNGGVEIGQLLVLAAALPVLRALTRKLGDERSRWIVWIGSAFVAHEAWHWLSDRWRALGEFSGAFAMPPIDAAFALGGVRVALLGAIALALALAFRQILRRVLPD
jgi:hypothetical protein